ncbi:lipid A deacylase LpxR family protein [Helicobacter sp. MIT 14-3879]|uniref:lipid A deacylase LpxR family protein n=1 Tax=Helicobacter sp. MIT 14-3879 TaxID=2040649 RepID=UPI000E1EC258|nr:lipid A deacylase LpxR family protein [Helicobacter sp. MIT 14-3879]RDU65023.1 DUF2219 domain-containing protein [Helicobacter sp. MIT 14-3879]
MKIKIYFLVIPCFLLSNQFDNFKKNENQIISILTENDAYFEPFIKSDKYYTAGHYISYVSSEYENIFLNKIALLSYLYDNNYSRFNITLNQEIYTPASKYTIPPPKNDALYGAAFFVTFGVINRTRNLMEQISLDIGFVGPWALGKQIQNGIHKITNNRSSLGWDYQIKNEFLLNLNYGLIYRWTFIEDFFDILPQANIFLGNSYTAISAGARMRIGYGIKNDFGIQKYKSKISQIIVEDGLKIYALVGINGSIVGRNIFIEGNTFGGVKSNLKLNRFLYEYELGLMIGYKYISLSYLYTRSSKAFKTQNDLHSYGSIRLEISF